MSYIPHDLVDRAVERAMKTKREFNDAEVRREMSTGLGDGLDELLANLSRELLKLPGLEPFEVQW
jgi:hypothetical protein